MITDFKHFSEKKALEALVWVASEWPGVTRYFACKTLYFADVAHLNDFGCPISGDKYVAMKNGPVPSFFYNLMKNETLDGDLKKDFDISIKTIEVKGEKSFEIKALRKANLDCFSKCETDYLKQALDYCKSKSFGELQEETHQHPAWINAREREKTSKNPSIDYEDMVKQDHPHREELLENIRENAYFLGFAA